MIGLRAIIAIAALLALTDAAAASPPDGCLSQEQRRAAITTHRAISLAKAVRVAKGHIAGGDVVRARLCDHGQGLVYVLTVLARDGKVTRANIDATSGTLVDQR
jgi:uncharacterized membrane protein YkoI